MHLPRDGWPDHDNSRIVIRTTHHLCERWHFLDLRQKSDDTYENGASETSKTRTGTRIVTWTPTIPVTVATFESLGLAARGPYHGGGGGGGLSTWDTTPYITPIWPQTKNEAL